MYVKSLHFEYYKDLSSWISFTLTIYFLLRPLPLTKNSANLKSRVTMNKAIYRTLYDGILIISIDELEKGSSPMCW